jgi:uracil-DNA glycosylase family 4
LRKRASKTVTCISDCRKCGLLKNQPPLFDRTSTNASVFWLGLSAVDSQNGKIDSPLSALTRTGHLISEIEGQCKGYCTFYKTNIVKCLPLKDKKIRYPKKLEMENCFVNFEVELKTQNPKLVVLLGKLVIDFISDKFNLGEVSLSNGFKYKVIERAGIKFVAVHHPSYVLVYKRKQMKKYIKEIEQIIRAAA